MFPHAVLTFIGLFLKKSIITKPFPEQLRIRLELLGPTYIKLGQIMAVREDILPLELTLELKELLDNVPQIPFEIIRGVIENSLGKPINEMFLDIKPEAVGSASLGQTHRATTIKGKPVILKVIKPGIRKTVLSDLKLLQLLAFYLELFFAGYQPKRIINEFCRYTKIELDLLNEADHAEIFSSNFATNSNVVFPKIYREFSCSDVLCMEYLKGIKPNEEKALKLRQGHLTKIIDIGAGAIIKMLYEDGFFHADLHSGNLILLPGPKIGFIDLGMIGRFDEKMRRSLLNYFYSLVEGNADAAAENILSIATMGEKGDTAGFKLAVTDLYRKYLIHSDEDSTSLASLILESLKYGAKYKIFFPVEMTLMVKALITFEGVGKRLSKNLNIPALSRKYIREIYFYHFSPNYIFNKILEGVPSYFEILMDLPKLSEQFSTFLKNSSDNKNNGNNSRGIRYGIIGAAAILSATFAFVNESDPILWIVLYLTGFLLIFLKS